MGAGWIIDAIRARVPVLDRAPDLYHHGSSRDDVNTRAWRERSNSQPHAISVPNTPLRSSDGSPFSMRDLIDRPDDATASIEQHTRSTARMLRSDPPYVAGGINGRMPLRVIDETSGPARFVIKRARQGGAHEIFAWEVARAIGADHLVAPVGDRGNGTAVVRLATGETFEKMNVHDGSRLEHALQHGYLVRHPEMPATEAARRARIDRQLAQVFDHIIANADRHANNAIFDASAGVVQLIDHGMVSTRGFDHGVVPAIRSHWMDGAGVSTARRGANLVATVELLPEVRQVLAQADVPRIERAVAQLMAHAEAALPVGKMSGAISPEYGTQVLRRLAAAIETGVIRSAVRF